VGQLSLKDAREASREAVAQLRAGIDLNRQKRENRTRIAAELRRARQVEADTGFSPGSFGELCERYIQQDCKALRSGRHVELVIRRVFLPAWGEIPVTDLRRRHLTALLDPIIAAGKMATALQVQKLAGRLGNIAIFRGELEGNPFSTPL